MPLFWSKAKAARRRLWGQNAMLNTGIFSFLIDLIFHSRDWHTPPHFRVCLPGAVGIVKLPQACLSPEWMSLLVQRLMLKKGHFAFLIAMYNYTRVVGAFLRIPCLRGGDRTYRQHCPIATRWIALACPSREWISLFWQNQNNQKKVNAATANTTRRENPAFGRAYRQPREWLCSQTCAETLPRQKKTTKSGLSDAAGTNSKVSEIWSCTSNLRGQKSGD